MAVLHFGTVTSPLGGEGLGVESQPASIESTIAMKLRTAFVLIIFGILTWLTIVGGAAASSPMLAPTPQPTPMSGRVATAAEVKKATIEWSQSAHADTYDDGMGANATCARCKSPMNWDPTGLQAQEQALDCSACKRLTGSPRPDLSGGVPVFPDQWQNITCAICHQPVGDSFSVAISFWNNETKQYETIPNPTALCAECHEGQHGFYVIEEQDASEAHKGWACTRCHGAHGAPARCTDCHDPKIGKGVAEHAQHNQVDCTACHDSGGLSIWQEINSSSRHYQQYIPVRFAHALTSWPSHDIRKKVDCRRCHHPRGEFSAPLAANISCVACHPDGAALFFCIKIQRDYDPTVPPAIGR
jgi:hypothetical protein